VITFAVPFYRGADYLDRAVRSALTQTVPDWRLVVSDDSADGGGAAVVERVGDARVRYRRNAHTLGMAGNWNRCLELADTPLVTLLHADDELLPNYAAVMTAGAAAHPDTAALYCRAVVVGPDGAPTFSLADRVKGLIAPRTTGPTRLAGPAGIAALLRGNFIMCPTVCYRTDALRGRRFDPRWRFVLDLDFFTRLLAAGDAIVGLPETAYAYRRHAGNATAEYTETLLRFEEEAALYDELAAEARRRGRGWEAVRRAGRGKHIVRLHLLYRAAADLVRGRLTAAATKLARLTEMAR
jgi:glycosyltransferase involved in cell wall biosynthesis